MSVFEPRISAHSYVDNWAHTAATAALVARGIFLAQCVCDLLKLELDTAKSYVWGSNPATRRGLKPLGFPVISQARELGGMMSFQGQVRNAAVVERCRALGPLFLKLRRSCSPLAVKLGALPAKFWARALHAISGCPLAESHINGLRTQATKALRLTSAGVNHRLRLGLETPGEIDPEFYQIWCCIPDSRCSSSTLLS